MVELKKEEMMEVDGGWLLPVLRILAGLATAAVGVHEIVHDDVCEPASFVMTVEC